MKALILSSNTGEGHNACAKALQEELMARGIPSDIRDGLGFLSKKTSQFISDWHVRLYRSLPKLYGEGYRYVERHVQPMDDDSAAFHLLASGTRRLRACIASQGYDIVVATHLFPAMMLTQIQREAPLPVRTAFIATDYTASPGYESIRADWIFIPDESLADVFAKPDVPPERVVASGIPVRGVFHERCDSATAKRRLGIAPQRRHLLVMSGSMGCGPLKRVLKRLMVELDGSADVSVICGTNRKLSRQLNRLLGHREDVHIHEFVDHMDLFMDSADLCLTKPGGLSVSEALAKRLPMVLLQAVDGCEPYNLRFCVDHGAAVTAQEPGEIAALCRRLIDDEAALEDMRAHIEACWRKHPAKTVCDCLCTAEG